jgi:choline dehydrogenase-like flavoprotein
VLLAESVLATYTAYNYAIIGSGTAGLVVANSLSANPNITVAAIEAGGSAYDNLDVTAIPRTIAEFSPGIGTSLDCKITQQTAH